MPVYDKYAPYLFAAYAVAGVVLVGLVAWSILRSRRARKRLEQAEKDDSR